MVKEFKGNLLLEIDEKGEEKVYAEFYAPNGVRIKKNEVKLGKDCCKAEEPETAKEPAEKEPEKAEKPAKKK